MVLDFEQSLAGRLGKGGAMSSFLATFAAREWIRTKPKKAGSPAAKGGAASPRDSDSNGPIYRMIRQELKRDREREVGA